MRPLLISKRMTSTTTLRRCSTSAAIAVSPALVIRTASPRAPSPNPYLGPCPAHIGSIRTAQEQARYLRGSVDRHVDKAGQPVDEAGKTIYVLWIRSRTRLSRMATGTVENRAAM